MAESIDTVDHISHHRQLYHQDIRKHYNQAINLHSSTLYSTHASTSPPPHKCSHSSYHQFTLLKSKYQSSDHTPLPFVMATLHVSPPSETHTHTTAGLFSPMTHGYAGSSTRTYSESTQSPPTSPLNYKSPALLNLPPATDTLINTGLESQPSLTARLHRRKKTYKPPTAPPIHASQPHDPLRAARLAWRLQEEYAEQLRVEEEQMRQSSSSFQRQQQKEFVRQTAPAQSNRHKRKAVRSKWQAFWLWFSLGFYRFTRRVKSVFK